MNIIVFKAPEHKNILLVKRCVALPGDTFQLKNAQVIINKDTLFCAETIKLHYRGYTSKPTDFKTLLKDSKIYYRVIDSLPGQQIIDMTMDFSQLKKISGSPAIDSVKINTIPPGGGRHPYMYDKRLKWSMDNLDPVVIPYNGMSIEMNYINYKIYGKMLRVCEGLNIRVEGDTLWNGDKLLKSYTFKNDYYFMMGDNRYVSDDSRFIGMIPEKLVIGKAKQILFSSHKGKFAWKRLLRRLK
jgi:signal peptidase I